MGAFVVSQKFNTAYKFAFTSRKGKTIFTSPGYELKFECEAAIENLKINIDKCTYIKQKASNGKYSFKIILEDHEVAVSRKYTTLLRLEKGINEVLRFASKAEVLDFTVNDFTF